MRTLLAPALLLLTPCAGVLPAQQLEPLPLDRLLEDPDSLRPRIPDYAWIPGEAALLETVRGLQDEPDLLQRFEPATRTRRELLTAADFHAGMARAGAEPQDDDGRLPRFEALRPGVLRFRAAGGVWHWDLEEDAPRAVLRHPKDADAVAVAPDDVAVAFVTAGDLHVRDRDGATRRLTWDGRPGDIDYGTGAHRREFGITEGLFWGPDGHRLAFTREDLRGVTAYPYADYRSLPPQPAHGRYPMAGDGHSKVTVGVFDRRSARLVYLEHDPDADLYWTNITFAPDGESVYVALVERSQDRCSLVEFDATTGARKRRVFTESDPQWVEPEHGPIFPPDGDGLLWFSDRGGYRQIWRVGPDGTFRYPETDGRYDVDEFLGFSEDGESMYVMAFAPDPRQRHLFEIRLGPPTPAMSLQAAAPKAQRLTPSVGSHRCQLSDTGWILDRWSQLYHPGLVQARAPDGRRHFVHQALDPLAAWARPTHRFFDVTADDGRELHGHVMFPAQTDALRKSPVLLYVYGGPHSQLVRHTWLGGANLWLYHMASIGYVVVRLDGRGTAHRGIDFAQDIHRGLGEIEVVDQLAALDAIGREYDFADLDRVGVHGWSYGGYLTLRLMLLAPQQFAAGVAGAPVTDWRQYETGYTERYMDTPAENPEGYASSSVLPLAGNLSGDLLLVHGTNDHTVMWSQAMSFLDACVANEVPIDFMAYPMQQHGLRDAARRHFYRKMTDYFLEHIPPPEPLPPPGVLRK